LFLGVCFISLVDNFIKPFVIGKNIKLPYLALFLGIIGGLSVYGFVGIVLAPVVISLAFVLIQIFREKLLTES
jgi:predicted PurR-regulated permease PerM